MSPAFPVRFNLSEYACSWLAGPDRDENGEETGGFVCVRVAHTGDDSQDWIESDATASTQSEAADVARALITEHEDAQQEQATEDETMPVAPACDHCGHPIAAQGVTLDADDDVDTTGQDRPRCSDTACTC